MNWHYAAQGQQAGPVNDEQFAELVRTGKINADTLVWREGMADWLPYSRVKSEAKPSPDSSETVLSPQAVTTDKTTEAACAECARVFPVDEMIRHGNVRICSDCKPAFIQKLSEGAQIKTGDLNYAGFGIRFGAKFVDGLILGLPFMVLFFIVLMPQMRNNAPPRTGQFQLLPLMMQLGFIFVRMAYDIFFLGKYGATPGKMLCKIRVVTADGHRIGYGRATGRFFAEMLSAMICYIGYIMVAFDNPQKRALHDHICNTRVVYK